MKTAAAIIAIVAVLVTGQALADQMASEMTGTVKSVDMEKHMITMEDGMSVTTNPDVKLDGIKQGDTVSVMTDGNHMGTMIEKK